MSVRSRRLLQILPEVHVPRAHLCSKGKPESPIWTSTPPAKAKVGMARAIVGGAPGQRRAAAPCRAWLSGILRVVGPVRAHGCPMLTRFCRVSEVQEPIAGGGFIKGGFSAEPRPDQGEQKPPKDIGLGSAFGTQSATA